MRSMLGLALLAGASGCAVPTFDPKVVDDDGDGVTEADGDCDDGDAGVFPGATEVCDPADVDEDCSGAADDEDDGVDPSSFTSFGPDQDGDRFAAEGGVEERCDAPAGWIPVAEGDDLDCDDDDVDIHPDATEVCDPARTDEDCDGRADDDDTDTDESSMAEWPADNDEDGFGDRNGYRNYACHEDAAYIAENELDCDDLAPLVNPDATEICDEDRTDENCNDLAEDADPTLDPDTRTLFPADNDGDGFGDATADNPACHVDAPYVADDRDDCDDFDRAVGPPPVQSWRDFDGDGDGDRDDTPQNEVGCTPSPGRVLNGDDCDDTDAATTYDTVRYVDADGDGFGDEATETPWCSGDDETGYSPAWTDCDDADDRRALFVDSCNSDVGACGQAETTCDAAWEVVVDGWTGNFGAWSPRLGDVTADGLPEVLLGTFDLRRDWSQIGDPDQIDFADQARLLVGATFDPPSGDWTVLDVTFELPVTEPSSNLGVVHGVLADFATTRAGNEIVLVDTDRENPAQGALWVVTDPPAAPVDGQVVALAVQGGTRRIEMPVLGANPQRRTGYAIEAGDLDATPGAELIVSAPTFSTDQDILYVFTPTALATATSFDDASVVKITDNGRFADGLGVDLAYTDDFASAQAAVALTTLGSPSDGPAAIIIRGEELDTSESLEVAYWAWFTTDFDPPFSHSRSARVAWADLDGDGSVDDLLFTVTDSRRARLYVIEDPEQFRYGRVTADSAAVVTYELPYPDCVELEARGAHVWLACPDTASAGVTTRGFTDRGLVFSFDIDVLAGAVQTLDTTNTDQISSPSPYNFLGTGGVTRGVFDGDEVLVFDHFTGWTDEGFSWVHVP